MPEPTGETVGRPELDRDSALRLLLIEDSTPDRDLVTDLLSDQLPHATVVHAADLQAALTRLAAEPFDAVLADLTLPDAEGLAVVRAVRAAHPTLAVLVLTGRASDDLALWALAEGAQDYLVKGEDDGRRLATALLHALQRERSEETERRYLLLARGLLDALEAPSCLVDAAGVVIAVNAAWRAFARSGGGTPEGTAEGASYFDAVDGVDLASADAGTAAAVGTGLRRVMAGTLARFEADYPCGAPGQARWLNVRISPTLVDGARGAVVSHVDVTERHTQHAALLHQSLHDALTGLPNRVLLADRLDQALLDGARRDAHVGVAFLDLDHFKRVNDSLGHSAGDALLIQVTQRLTAGTRAGDTLARLSGDEFVVVWRDLDTRDEARLLTERLVALLDAPFVLGTTTVDMSVSAGVSVSGALNDVEALLSAADAAMYDAKRRGAGLVRVWSPELSRTVLSDLTLESELREALARAELVLHYQPVVELRTGRPVAVEALARWEHPRRGLLAADEFIPVAEATDLVVPLGAWALSQACRDVAALPGGLDVAVNVSVRQLTAPGLVEQVRSALAGSGLAPGRLLLEVTESAVMQDEATAAVTLDRLAELGVRVAVDDFGTGYGSLLYLRRYAVSALKLDRTFVAGIGRRADDEAICRSVVDLARSVGCTSIAEGVETADQLASLAVMGCRQAQGFLWSPAVPLAGLAAALEACRRVPVAAPARRRGRVPVSPLVAEQIASLIASGASLTTVAAALNQAGTPHPGGVRWTAASVAAAGAGGDRA